MRDVLILTSGQEEHHYAARTLRDRIEDLAGTDVRVEIREVGDEGTGGWIARIRGMMGKKKGETEKLLKWVRRTADGTLGRSRWPQFRRSVALALDEGSPELVVFFDPAVGLALQERVGDRSEAGFQRIGVALEAEDLRAWEKVPADLIWAADEGPATELKRRHPTVGEVRPGGWPVRPEFVCREKSEPRARQGAPFRVLYLVNSRRRKAIRTVEKLLENQAIRVTAVVGREEELKADLKKVFGKEERFEVRGWIKDLAGLIREHDLVITKPGIITVREILASGRPVVLVEGGKKAEERKDMCRLVVRLGCGALADSPGEIGKRVEAALEGGGVGCREWRRRARKEAWRSTGAADRLAETVVRRVRSATVAERLPELRLLPAPVTGKKQLLMVDLHCHTVYSDGRMSLRELVDFYGRRGFDAMAVTDHVVDKGNLIGRLVDLTGLVMTAEDLPEYFRALQEERNRAWIKYRMILFPGMEFNMDGLTAKRSAHLLGVDLKEPIDPGLKLKEICQAVRAQGGLTIAAHPHHMTSMWGRDTLFLWERQEEYKPYIDAWEIGNRDDLFNPVGLKRLPFIAGSDFHKPKHLTSWKTLLFCEKDPEAIKACIRENKDVSITLYRDHRFGKASLVSGDQRNAEEFQKPKVSVGEGTLGG
ncbi:MAG: hypothetical protein EBT77_02985 [Verrucomicrobia bacterium]|nr:hypothetical protein [Verrucomicrobiota bacterium]